MKGEMQVAEKRRLRMAKTATTLSQIEARNHFLLGRMGEVMDLFPHFSNLMTIESLRAAPIQSFVMVTPTLIKLVNLRIQQKHLCRLILGMKSLRSRLISSIEAIDDPGVLRELIILQMEAIDKIEHFLHFREQIENKHIKELLFSQRVYRVLTQEVKDAKHDIESIMQALNPILRSHIERAIREFFGPSLRDRTKIVIDLFRKSLSKKLEENKLGDINFSFSEEEKKEFLENAKLAQQSLIEKKV